MRIHMAPHVAQRSFAPPDGFMRPHVAALVHRPAAGVLFTDGVRGGMGF